MKNHIQSFLAFVCLATTFNATLTAGQVEDALQRSQETGKPLLVVASSEYCGPCRKLHQLLESDVMRGVRGQCDVLEIKAGSAELAAMDARYPGFSGMVPMVYAILPDGDPLYVKAGGLSQVQLTALLTGAAELSALSQDVGRGDVESVAKAARLATRTRGAVATMAKQLEQRGVSNLIQQLGDLEKQIATEDEVCSRAFKIAKIFYDSREVREVHLASARILMKLQKDPRTSVAARQAQHLVNAKEILRNGNSSKAKKCYMRVIKIDADSTAARFARLQISRL